MRVLVVEDDPICRETMVLTLQEEFGRGLSIDAVADGDTAISKVCGALQQGEPYRVVLLDIRLPRRNGQEVLRRIREHEKTLRLPSGRESKIIMTSGLSDRNVLKAIQNNADSYLVKPITREHITREVAKYTGDYLVEEE
jgi:two-component system chemotaxis response regulator CheY